MPPTPSDPNETLDRLRAEAAREWQAKQDAERRARARRAAVPRRDPASWARRAALLAAWVVALILFPFVVLVRVAVTAYAEGHPTWLALGAATVVAVGVVTLYAAWISKKLSGRARLAAVSRTVALPLVLGYTLYALLYVSAAHAKGDAVRAEYLRLHPILRIAVSTLMLADGELLITDMGRVPPDYPRMGLPVYDGSLHYRQRDGYAHALDLRTSGRGMIRNALTRLYFELMGFDTLRHVGTADHLHVELRH
jgi:hypothetical protein